MNRLLNRKIISLFIALTVTASILTGCSSTAGSINNDINKNNVQTTNTDKNESSSVKNEAQNDSLNTKVSENLKIHFIDVGQADSILIQQKGKNMLIDAGNNADNVTIINYLKKNNVKKIDILIGTHPHEDHIGGMDTVINNFAIGKIYMPKVTSNTKTFKDVLTAINYKGLKITTPISGAKFSLGDMHFTILAPNNSQYEDLNNYSIVLRMTFGQRSFMFDGDAESLSEKEILNKGFNINADVIKIGHHGSNSSTSEEFIKSVNPKYAIIMAGKNNDYGHPHKSTMERLKDKGITVYRTDECGTIILTSDGNKINFNVRPGSYNYSGSGNASSSYVTPIPKNTTISTGNKNTIVYRTKSGTKYHTAECKYLSTSKIAITLEEAKNLGLEPCKACNPPLY